MNLTQLLLILRARKKIVLLTLMITVALALGVSLVVRPAKPQAA